MRITELYVYPIKSCAGIRLERADVGSHGFYRDRLWMLVSEKHLFLTQRECPLLSQVQPSFGPHGALILHAPGMPEISIPPAANHAGQRVEVKVWADACVGEEESQEVSDWFCTFLSRPCKLLRMPEDFFRYASAPHDREKKGLQAFVDAYPILVIGEESLRDLNSRLSTPVPMNRFRPNIVVSGNSPYSEDAWRQVQIGEVSFVGAKECGRCVTITIDQATTERGKEPLLTLSRYRKFGATVKFGQYLIQQNYGTIAIGDTLSVLSERSL